MPLEQKDVDKKIPTWNGDPDGWETYRGKVRWHARGIPEKDVMHLTAKLAGNVTSKAWLAVNWLSEYDKDVICAGGIDSMLTFFKDGLLENPIPEAGRHFKKYVYNFRREKNESMKLYVTRHIAELNKLEEAMNSLKVNAVTLHDKVRGKIQRRLETLQEPWEEEYEYEDNGESENDRGMAVLPHDKDAVERGTLYRDLGALCAPSGK
jgi:hypothetical protein